MKLSANISLMFNEMPMPERFAAARDAGFDAVEIQFPDEEDVAALVAEQHAAGMPVDLVNVPRGEKNRAGLAALPGKELAFAAALERCVATARALGAGKANVLAGIPPEDADPALCREVFIANLRHAADRLGREGIRVMVEPVNRDDVPGFFLTGLDAALEILDAAAHPNLALQFDLYHMTLTEPDLCTAILSAGSRIGHVQFADAPGRNEPGTGRIDFAAALNALRDAGYDGTVAAEYRPRKHTEDDLGWMTEFRRCVRPLD